MKVLVIGSGGREHALAWKIKQSPRVRELYCAPGNGGMKEIAECVDIAAENIPALLQFAKEKGIELTVVGPEAPLVKGIVDIFEMEGLRIFGPTKRSAQLEGSKIFSKEFMARHRIPTARFVSCQRVEEAVEALNRFSFPVVVKADGLAAGKGVVICASAVQAREALDEMMEQDVYQGAGKRVILEEYLEGEEASILAISDGNHYVLLDSSQDHKRIFDNDQGPNTGGMGAYSPAPVVTEALMKVIDRDIIKPTIEGMRQEGNPFKGVLYAGLMISAGGGPQVLEYNVRFGDPETQAVLPRLKDDLVDILWAACEGHLERRVLQWDKRPCVCVVMASGGYPGDYEKGREILGLDRVRQERDGVVFHAGTKLSQGKIVTAGGRVLGVTGLGATIEQAIAKSYTLVERITFEKCFYRKDIGAKALRRGKITAR